MKHIVVVPYGLAGKLAMVRSLLDEQQWRLLLDAEAESIGRG